MICTEPYFPRKNNLQVQLGLRFADGTQNRPIMVRIINDLSALC